MTEPKQVKLAFSYWPTGHHASGWRLPGAEARGTADPVLLRKVAQIVEAAKFDYFFVGNQLQSTPAQQYHSHLQVFKLDAFAVANYVAAVTDHVGIVATLNSNFNEPYNIARAAASLDHLSNGRAGINLITSRVAAPNYGRTDAQTASTYDDQVRFNEAISVNDNAVIPAEEVYGRLTEFTEILWGLWESWEPGAILADKERGEWVDEQRAHTIDFVGRYFQVRGPLNLPSPPQGRIPIVHAGSSELSKEYGAKYADIRFSPFVDERWNRAYYADIKARLGKYGRAPEEHLILPGITFYAAETASEAHTRFREVQSLHANAYSAAAINQRLGVNVEGIDPEERLISVVDVDSFESVIDLGPAGLYASRDKGSLIRYAQSSFGDENITLRQFFQFLGNMPYTQPSRVGSAVQLADWIEEQVDSESLDGIVVFPPYLLGGLEAFTELVVPELQRRGRFRKEYATATFREHFGFPSIVNRHAADAVRA